MSKFAIAACLLLVAGAAGAAPSAGENGGPSANQGNVLVGKAAFGGYRENRPGVRRLIRPQDLPGVTESSSSRAEAIARPKNAMPQVPTGFSVALLASGLEAPRAINIAPNGDIFVSESSAGRIRILRLGQSGKPAVNQVFASGLHQPFGIAFYPLGPNPQWIYIADSNRVVRFPYKSGEVKASGKPQTIIPNVPSTSHWTRDIVFTPDGKRLLLAVGSGSNVAEQIASKPPSGNWIKDHPLGEAWGAEQGRAVLLSYDPDGKDKKTIATGLRNCAGLSIEPKTGQPWCVVNERDGLGNNTPFDYATSVKDGAFYGWPWYYIGSHPDPRNEGDRPDLKGKVTIPDVLFQAHSAPLQIAFYEGNAFPAGYKGSAFVALHGSWNRTPRTGYKVVRLLFDQSGKATGVYEDFMTGFVLPDGKVWGRPVGVAVAADGSLLVGEDGSGTLWRVTHSPGGQ